MKNIVFILTFLISSASFGYNDICVLSLFASDSSEAGRINMVFENYQRADIFESPSISEIQHCFSGDYQEVIWVSHGVISGIITPFTAPIHNFENKKQILYPRFFENIAKNLNHSIKLRIAFCGAGEENLKNTMDSLIKRNEELGGDVNYSPKLDFMSHLQGKPVTNLSLKWLSQSIDKTKLVKWMTNRSRFCLQGKRNKQPCQRICTSDTQRRCDRNSSKYIIPLETI